jgi:hypothetical protein
VGPIICIDMIIIILMDDINILAHKPHLKVENIRISTVIRKDELDCVAVSCSYKSLPKEHMAALVDQPVAGKTLAKMGVETNFITAAPPSTKSNRMEDHRR